MQAVYQYQDLAIQKFTEVWQHVFATYTPSTIVWVGTFLFHEIAYFGFSFLFFLCDFVPFLQRWKIQPNKVNDWKSQLKCLKWVLVLHVVFQLPLMIIFSPTMLDVMGMSIDVPLPSWRSVALNCIANMIVEDCYFYFIHRLLHHPRIYKHIHKVHHEYAAPFGMAGEYAHPAETLLLGVGTALGPLMFTRHLLTLWAWLGFRLIQVVECHSGYDFPWSPNRWLPFWGGAEYHDFHHRTSLGPYSSTFTYMDSLFGTNKHYLAEKNKLAALNKAE